MNQLTLAERLVNAMDAAQIAWWEMELPSGKVLFGHNKTDLLGHNAEDFTHYKDFTDLVDPADYEPMMEAMRAHIRGEKDVYETIYRIQAKNGTYLTFYDRGKIVERDGDHIRIAGMVMNAATLQTYAHELATRPYEPLSKVDK